MAYGDNSGRRPPPHHPVPDASALLAAAQQHLDKTGASACIVRSAQGDLLVAVGSPSDKLFALLQDQLPLPKDRPEA